MTFQNKRDKGVSNGGEDPAIPRPAVDDILAEDPEPERTDGPDEDLVWDEGDPADRRRDPLRRP